MGKSIHIKPDGTPDKCNAKKGRCPYGEHFSTMEEAQEYADKKLEKMKEDSDTFVGRINEVSKRTEKPSSGYKVDYNYKKAIMDDLVIAAENLDIDLLTEVSSHGYLTTRSITSKEKIDKYKKEGKYSEMLDYVAKNIEESF